MTDILRDPEVATTFGALDESPLGAAMPMSAYHWREMSRSANLLATHREPLLNVVYEGGAGVGDDELPGNLIGHAAPSLIQITPTMSLPKKPGLTLAEFDITAEITAGNLVQFFFGTSETVKNPELYLGSPHTLAAVGSGAFELYAATGVPMSAAVTEPIFIAARCLTHTGVLADPAVIGGPSNGTIISASTATGVFAVTVSSSYNAQAIANAGHVIVIADPSSPAGKMFYVYGNIPITGQLIPMSILYLHPFASASEVLRSPGQTFEIFQLPRFRVANVAGWSSTRVL